MQSRLAELTEDFAASGRLSWIESQTRAALRLQGEIERELNRKTRMRRMQAIATDRVRQRLAVPDVEGAAKAMLDFDPSLRHVGENVSTAHQSLRGTAFAMMSSFVETHRSKAGGFTRDKAGLPDVVRGLFGEATTPEAKALAEGIQASRSYLVGAGNAAGMDIVQRKAWGWVQGWDRAAVANVTKEDFVGFVLPRLGNMIEQDGSPMTARRVRQVVEGSYDSILGLTDEAIGGPFDPKFGSPVNARVHHRELVFADSKAWLEAQERFGNGDIFGAIVGETDRLARDVALVQTLGPYPAAQLETMKELVDRGRQARARDLTGREAQKAIERVGKHRGLQALYDQVAGVANVPADSGWARASQSGRNLITASRLGGAIFASLSDVSSLTLTARYNGMSAAKVVGELAKQLADPAHRRMAARAGFVAETALGHSAGAARLMGEVLGAPSTARIADTALRVTGLNLWTDGARAAFKLEFTGHLTDNAGKAFGDLDDATRRALTRHGVTAADWDLYRSTSIWTDPETGAEFIRPEDVYREFQMISGLPVGEKSERLRAANKFAAMIATEGNFAVVTPTPRVRAMITGGTAPGSFWGEIIRNATLFKSFGVSFVYLHFNRAMAEHGLVNRAKYIAWASLGMTMFGALAEQASDIRRGKDPRDMTDPRFWASAVIRGGSLGPIGDFAYSTTSRHGQNLAEALLGPVYGQLLAGAKLTVGNVQDLIEKGRLKNPGADMRQFLEGMVPGASTWYLQLGLQRLVLDELEKAIDGPEAAARFRRIEDRARKEFGQAFWWRPGQ